jgi:cytoskeletal protein CcmA (bactofilin family)
MSEHRSLVEFRKEGVMIAPDAAYMVPIMPFSKHDLDRTVTIGAGAYVEGDIWGVSVEIGPKAEVKGRVFGERGLTVAAGALVHGDVMTRGILDCGEGVRIGSGRSANAYASDVRMAAGCVVDGNIISSGEVSLAAGCMISGNVFSRGTLSMGKGCEARDVISLGSIFMAEGVRIQDDVVWARGDITALALELAGRNPSESQRLAANGWELNLNRDKVRATPSAAAEDEFLMSLREMLRARPGEGGK